MQSLLTVNNNVSLLSVTIAPSTFIATLTLSLVFLALYLPPLRFRRGRSNSAPTAKYNYNNNNHHHQYDYDYDYNYDYQYDTRDSAKIDGNRFAPYFNNTWWQSYWNRNRAPDPIELRDHPPLIEGLPQSRATLAIEDGRRRLGTGSRLAVRANRKTSKTRGREKERPVTPDEDITRDAIQPVRSPRRLSSRLRIGQPIAAALRLPLYPQRLPEVRYRSGPERDGKFDGLRRWIQPASLEAPRKR